MAHQHPCCGAIRVTHLGNTYEDNGGSCTCDSVVRASRCALTAQHALPHLPQCSKLTNNVFTNNVFNILPYNMIADKCHSKI